MSRKEEEEVLVVIFSSRAEVGEVSFGTVGTLGKKGRLLVAFIPFLLAS